MQLIRLNLQNFKCFEHESIAFPVEFGLYLLTGQNLQEPALSTNAIGKSTILEALTFALYGKTAKGTKAGKLLNRNTEEAGYSVSIILDMDNSKEYVTADQHTITRSWNPNQLTLDKEEVSQDVIDKFIGLTYEQFLHCVLFQQNAQHFIDLTAGGKLQFLSDLFKLDKWTRATELAKNKLTPLTITKTTNENNLATLEHEVYRIASQLDTLEIEALDFEEDKKLKINELTNNINKLEEEINLFVNSDEGSKLQELLKTNHQNEFIIKESKRNNNETLIQLQSEYVVLKRQVENHKEKLDRLSLTRKCPTCGQKLPQESNEDLIETTQEEINTLESKLPYKSDQIKALEAIQVDLEKHLTTFQMAEIETKTKLAEIQASTGVIEEKKIRLLGFIDTLDKLLKNKNPYKSQIESLETALIETQGMIVNAEQAVKDSIVKMSQYEFWKGLFPQVRLEILNDLISELELYFNEAFSRIGLMNWAVKISTQRELANERLKNELTIILRQNDQEMPLESLSGGELQRVRLVSAIGLSELIKSRLGLNWNLLLLDEPFAGLSKEGIENVLDLLRNLGDNGSIVMLAEHRVLDLARFDKVFEITKDENGNSSIKYN